MTIDIHQQPREHSVWYDRLAAAPGPERGCLYRFRDRLIARRRNALSPIAEVLVRAASRHA